MKNLSISVAIAGICIGSLLSLPANAGTWRQTTIADFLTGVMDSTTVTDTVGGELELALRTTKILDDFQVDAGTPGYDQSPHISSDSPGNFVVVWDVWGADYDVYAQRFTRDGVKIGPNFKVNDDTTNSNQHSPSVFVDADGDFVVVWTDGRMEENNIYAQLYDSSGAPQGPNFEVDGATWNAPGFSSVSGDPEGNFVVAWTDWRSGQGDIYARRYTKDGQPLGEGFMVNDDSGASQKNPQVWVAVDGGFVITWNDGRNLGWQSLDVYAQIYDSNGIAQGGNFRVNEVIGRADSPFISGGPGGDFIISWTDGRDDTGEVYAQRFTGDAQFVGPNFRVSYVDEETGVNLSGDVAVNRRGHFLIVWNWVAESSKEDIYAQLYNLSGFPQLGNFIVNKYINRGGSCARVANRGTDSFTIARTGHYEWHIVACQWSYFRCPQGIFQSVVYDVGDTTTWQSIEWKGLEPESTSLEIQMRASDSAFSAEDTLPQWVPMDNGQSSALPSGRYVQYQALLETQSKRATPILYEITLRNTSGVEPFPADEMIPKYFSLAQNYPNPFNSATLIRYTVPDRDRGGRPHHTTLKIYNILGEEVITLVDKKQRVGRYEVVWDGRDRQGKEVKSGIYLCSLTVDDFKEVRKMVLIR